MQSLQSSSLSTYAYEPRASDHANSYPEYAGPITLDALIGEIERRRDEFDQVSHVPRDMVAKMKRAGIFRASTPQRFGGDALPPPQFLRILERIAIADGSAAWVAAFGSANTYLAALPIETQQHIYATGRTRSSPVGSIRCNRPRR